MKLYFVIRSIRGAYVGMYTIDDIREHLLTGGLQEGYYATESDGRSYSEFQKTSNGNWRTLSALLAHSLDETKSTVEKPSTQLPSAGRSHRPGAVIEVLTVVLMLLGSLGLLSAAFHLLRIPIELATMKDFRLPVHLQPHGIGRPGDPKTDLHALEDHMHAARRRMIIGEHVGLALLEGTGAALCLLIRRWLLRRRLRSQPFADGVLEAEPCHDEKPISLLIKNLQDERAHVRWKAAQALGKMGASAKQSIPALTAALNDSDRLTRDAAREALSSIQGGAP